MGGEVEGEWRKGKVEGEGKEGEEMEVEGRYREKRGV